MPNWCSNSLTLKHQDASKIKLALDVFEKDGFLNHFVPMPNNEWDYTWCVENWGTKWDISSSGSGELLDSNTAQFSFDSAWAPPIEAYKKICDQGFEVTAYYYEPGVGFVGKFVGDDQGCFDDCYDLADLDSQTVREEIGEELDEYWGISESMLIDEEQELIDELDELGCDLINTSNDVEHELDDTERAKQLPPHTD